MDPVTVTTTIACAREEVFEYLADVANHPEFTDHFLVDWRLTREDSYGQGAGGRFRVVQRFNRFARGDMTLLDLQAPRRLVAVGRGGRYNRIRTLTTWTLEAASGGGTRVELEVETEPAILSDRIVEALGARRFARRGWGRALRRLRSVLEEGEDRGPRATVSGGARKPATGFRL